MAHPTLQAQLFGFKLSSHAMATSAKVGGEVIEVVEVIGVPSEPPMEPVNGVN